MPSRESQAPPRLYGTAIPLAKSIALDSEELRERLRAVANAAGAPARVLDGGPQGKRGFLSSLRGQSGSVEIEMAGIGLRVSVEPKPLCNAKAMHAFINPTLWKGGISGMTAHKAHIIVSETDATAGNTSTDAMFDRATAVTLAAAAVADMPGAQGVIWLPARNSLPVSTFGSEMERFMDGQAPLLFWVRSQSLPPPAQSEHDFGAGDELEPGIATVGLTAFMGAEIIAPPSYCDRDVALDYAFGLASAVIDENRRLKDGAVMGHGCNRMRLVMREGGPYSDNTYWELESLHKPEPKRVRPVQRKPAPQHVQQPPQMQPPAQPVPQMQPPVQPPQVQQPQRPMAQPAHPPMQPSGQPLMPPPVPPQAPPAQAQPTADAKLRKRPSTWRRSAAEPAAAPAQQAPQPQQPAQMQPPMPPQPPQHPPQQPALQPPGLDAGLGLGTGLSALPASGGALVDPDEVLKAMNSGNPLDALPAALRPSTPQMAPPMPGQPIPGQPMPGQPMPGQPMTGQPMTAQEAAHYGLQAPPADDDAMRAAMNQNAQNVSYSDAMDELPAALRPSHPQQAPQQPFQQPPQMQQANPVDPQMQPPAQQSAQQSAEPARRKPPRRPPPAASSQHESTDIPRPSAEESFDEAPPEPEPDVARDLGEDSEDGVPFFDKHLRSVGRG